MFNKKIMIVAWMIPGFFFLASAWAGNVVDRIVAVVNDDVIVLSDLNRTFQPVARRISAAGHPIDRERRLLFKAREGLLNQMIEEKLADQEIEKYNVKVEPKEIDNAIEQLKRSRMVTDEQLRQAIEAQGMTMEDYRKRIEDEILRARLVNTQVKSKIVITEADIEQYYNEQPEKFGAETKYHLHNLVVVRGATDADTARQTLQAARQQLEEGISFEEVVKNIRTTPGGQKSGELGAFKLQSLAPNIAGAVKNLAAGQFTEVIDTDQGWQVFFVSEVNSARAKPLEAVSEEIQDILYRKVVDEKFSAWMKELREKSYIKIIL